MRSFPWKEQDAEDAKRVRGSDSDINQRGVQLFLVFTSSTVKNVFPSSHASLILRMRRNSILPSCLPPVSHPPCVWSHLASLFVYRYKQANNWWISLRWRRRNSIFIFSSSSRVQWDSQWMWDIKIQVKGRSAFLLLFNTNRSTLLQFILYERHKLETTCSV